MFVLVYKQYGHQKLLRNLKETRYKQRRTIEYNEKMTSVIFTF